MGSMAVDNDKDTLEIPILIGDQRKWISGVDRRTTCDNIIYLLLTHLNVNHGDVEDVGRYAIYENWRGVERPLAGRTKLSKVWAAYGADSENVVLSIRLLDLDTSCEVSHRKLRVHQRSRKNREQGEHGLDRYSSSTKSLAAKRQLMNSELTDRCNSRDTLVAKRQFRTQSSDRCLRTESVERAERQCSSRERQAKRQYHQSNGHMVEGCSNVEMVSERQFTKTVTRQRRITRYNSDDIQQRTSINYGGCLPLRYTKPEQKFEHVPQSQQIFDKCHSRQPRGLKERRTNIVSSSVAALPVGKPLAASSTISSLRFEPRNSRADVSSTYEDIYSERPKSGHRSRSRTASVPGRASRESRQSRESRESLKSSRDTRESTGSRHSEKKRSREEKKQKSKTFEKVMQLIVKQDREIREQLYKMRSVDAKLSAKEAKRQNYIAEAAQRQEITNDPELYPNLKEQDLEVYSRKCNDIIQLHYEVEREQNRIHELSSIIREQTMVVGEEQGNVTIHHSSDMTCSGGLQIQTLTESQIVGPKPGEFANVVDIAYHCAGVANQDGKNGTTREVGIYTNVAVRNQISNNGNIVSNIQQYANRNDNLITDARMQEALAAVRQELDRATEIGRARQADIDSVAQEIAECNKEMEKKQQVIDRLAVELKELGDDEGDYEGDYRVRDCDNCEKDEGISDGGSSAILTTQTNDQVSAEDKTYLVQKSLSPQQKLEGGLHSLGESGRTNSTVQPSVQATSEREVTITTIPPTVTSKPPPAPTTKHQTKTQSHCNNTETNTSDRRLIDDETTEEDYVPTADSIGRSTTMEDMYTLTVCSDLTGTANSTWDADDDTFVVMSPNNNDNHANDVTRAIREVAEAVVVLPHDDDDHDDDDLKKSPSGESSGSSGFGDLSPTGDDNDENVRKWYKKFFPFPSYDTMKELSFKTRKMSEGSESGMSSIYGDDGTTQETLV